VPVTPGAAVASFAAVAAVLTITPGLDTALVLRAAVTGSRREAAATAAGIVAALFVWGAAAAAGVSALVATSDAAYAALRWAGTAWLLWLGLRLLVRAARGPGARTEPDVASRSTSRAFWTGSATNLLNPKVGVFYVALLPQFLPAGADPLAMGLLLAAVHAVLSTAWFVLLIALAATARRWLRRPRTIRAVDGVTGAVLVGFGLRLATGR
jgi:threonine/homoserine/homoserine lactone efflux protein